MGIQIDSQGIPVFDNIHRKNGIYTRKYFSENTSQRNGHAIQRKLQRDGIAAIILSIRVDV
jgi:hypothetical protein